MGPRETGRAMDARAARAGPHLEISSGFRHLRPWLKAVVLGMGIVPPTILFAGGVLSAVSGDDRAWAWFVLGTTFLAVGLNMNSRTTVVIGGAAVESRTLWRSIRIPFSDVRVVHALHEEYGPAVFVKSRRRSSIWLYDEFSVADRERFLEQLRGHLEPFGVRIEPMEMEYPRIFRGGTKRFHGFDWRTGEGSEDAAWPSAAEPEGRSEERHRPAYLILVVGGAAALLALLTFVLALGIEHGSFGPVGTIVTTAAGLVVGEIYLLSEHEKWFAVAQGLLLCAMIFIGAYPLVAIAADIRDPLADPAAWPAFVLIIGAAIFLMGLEVLGSWFRRN